MTRTSSSNRSRRESAADSPASTPGLAMRLIELGRAYRLFGSLSSGAGLSLGELVLDRPEAFGMLGGHGLDRGDDVGMASRDVVLLAWVFHEVVEQRGLVRRLRLAAVLRLREEMGFVGAVPQRVELRASVVVDVLAGTASGSAQHRAKVV